MVRTQIQLEERQMAGLREAARRNGVSLAEMIRRAVDRLLAVEKVSTESARRSRAIAAIGCGRSGKSDVSSRHDEYLEEGYRS